MKDPPRLCLPVVVLCTAISANVLSWLSSFGCWFLSVDASAFLQEQFPEVEVEGRDGGVATVTLGFWTRQTDLTDTSCTFYHDDITFDSAWLSGKYFSMLASILGLVTLFASCVVVFLDRPYWSKWMAVLNFICCIFQSLAFTAYNSAICKESAHGCGWLGGTSWGIAAAVLYFVLVLFHIFMARRVASAESKKAEDGGDAEEDDPYAKAERYAAMGKKEKEENAVGAEGAGSTD